MDIAKGLNTKTALEHLIFLSNTNIVGVCRELQITPQQFADWIKKRRPVPADRLLQLVGFFEVPANSLVDEKQFARSLSTLTGIELEMLVVSNQIKQTCSKENHDELSYRLDRLEEEKQRQIRIARLSAILENNDSTIMGKIDNMLDEIEKYSKNEE